MRRIVDLYTVPGDQKCEEIREFLEDQDIRLNIRDMREKPLRSNEIAKLIRHLDLKHFVNHDSPAYAKHKLNGNLPEREKLFTMIAEDNDLLIRPIIVAGRLMVVGPNRHKIVEMLQLKSNGNGVDDYSGSNAVHQRLEREEKARVTDTISR